MIRLILRLLLLALVAGPIVFAWAALAPAPALPQRATLSPAQAAQARALVDRIEAATSTGRETATVSLSAADLNALIATGARVVRPLRGIATIDEGGVTMAVSGRLPAPQAISEAGVPLWVNFSTTLAPAAAGFEVTEVRLGRMSLPPALARGAVRRGLDLASGGDLGTVLMGSVVAMEVRHGRADLTLATATQGGETLFSRVTGGVRDTLGLGRAEDVARHYAALSQAARAGALPGQGSLTPWLRRTLEGVAAAGHEDAAMARADLAAALQALAAHCGSASAITRIAGEIGADGDSPCQGTTLGGRADLRQHFTLSAALQGAGGSAASFGFGEIKELVDAGRDGGSGFSFDDIAADIAGIRFAEAARAAVPGDLPAFSARLTSEAAFVPPLDDLPSFMSEADFTARYGGPDSPRYAAQLDDISARIDRLPAFGG